MNHWLETHRVLERMCTFAVLVTWWRLGWWSVFGVTLCAFALTATWQDFHCARRFEAAGWDTTADFFDWKVGATRAVLCVGCLAFKFPVFWNWQLLLHGLLANMQEAEWSPYRNLHARALAHVYFAGPLGLFNVMERGVPMSAVELEWFSGCGGANFSSRWGYLPVERKPIDFMRRLVPYPREMAAETGDNIMAVDYGGSGCARKALKTSYLYRQWRKNQKSTKEQTT